MDARSNNAAPILCGLRLPENRRILQGTDRFASLLNGPQRTSLCADPTKSAHFRHNNNREKSIFSVRHSGAGRNPLYRLASPVMESRLRGNDDGCTFRFSLPIQARGKRVVKSGENGRDAVLGPARLEPRLDRPRFGRAFDDIRACPGAAFLVPFFAVEKRDSHAYS